MNVSTFPLARSQFFAQSRYKVEVVVLAIILHIVPEVNCDATMALSKMMKPETRKVQGVTRFHPNSYRASIGIVWVILKIGLQRVHRDPRNFGHVRDGLDFQGFRLLRLVVCNVLSGRIVFVVEPRHIRGRVEDDVFVTMDDAVDVFVRVFVSWNRKEKSYTITM